MTDLDVVIPCFNMQALVARAIESAHIAGANRIIVVDDGSADDSAMIAEKHGATVIRQANSGAAAARRTGAKGSTATYLIFLDADDQLLAPGVKESLLLLESNVGSPAVGGAVVGVMPNGKTTRLKSHYSNSISTADLLSKGFGPWPPAAAVVRRLDYLKAENQFPNKLTTDYAEDFEMFIRLSMIGKILKHDVPAAKYRMFDGKSSKDYLKPIMAKERIVEYYGQALKLPHTVMSGVDIRLASHTRAIRTMIARAEYGKLILLIVKSLAFDPKINFLGVKKGVQKFIKRDEK
ncbi:glycosyltransferase family 2 protein [Paeniglutamicibacter sp. Y32M11]|uniref:glycosyltransferase family 2 protein n=1 Tax=Paeniglutamicibacter sp. Y32M11 TaxID=2853258 RepID=UPI001C53258C|nr:glycosyltransferase family 2 protein [Paeniglutamicibacter sp. Y32M11]QXQ09642.1 glycosyltransferase [Paeniglutamicibacter sp. Y32M11]